MNEMNLTILNIKIVNKVKLLPFQKGILLSNSSLIELYKHLRKTYNTEYILKARLNQDILETFFATLRLMGGPNDHPCSLDIKYRLKCHLLSKYSSDMLSHDVPTTDNVNNRCFKEIEKKS